jgi:hypothetical protein
MVKMCKRICDLTNRDTNMIVMHFGLYSKTCLAEFFHEHEHWKDKLTQWQKHHPNQDSTEQAMVLSPPQQDNIHCTTWVCCHRHHIPWPAKFFSVKDLRSRNFEPIHAQMECEEEGKITGRTIPELTNILK